MKKTLSTVELQAAGRILAAVRASERSQDELAAEVGVSQGLIWQWANARVPVPANRAAALGRALHLDARDVSPAFCAIVESAGTSVPCPQAMTLGKRIQAARKHAQLTQAQLAERVGITQQVLARLERDGASSTKALALIAVECCVAPRWLATGESEMLDATPYIPGPIQLTQQELALIANYRACDHAARAMLERQALNLAQQALPTGDGRPYASVCRLDGCSAGHVVS